MIISVLNTIVGDMNGNADSYFFYHGERDWQNLNSDEAEWTDNAAVYLDGPIKIKFEPTKSGYIGERYPVNVLFLRKSELEWTPQEHDTNCFSKLRLDVREFLTRLGNSELVDEFQVNGDALEIMNLFDVNTDAIILPLIIKPNIDVSVCVS